MKNKRLLLLVFGILFVFGLLFLCNSTERNDTSLQKVRITQAGKEKFLLYLPLYVAMEKGYFAEQGLDVSLTFSGNDDQVVTFGELFLSPAGDTFSRSILT